MKMKKSFMLLVLISLLLCVLSACSKTEEETSVTVYSRENKNDTTEKVFQNDNLEFHFDPATTQFYVVKKSTGYTWYSNPKDLANDTIATGINKKDLQSTISIKYNNISGSETLMTNFGSSIEKGNFSYEYLNDGVKVNYTIGDLKKVALIPLAVTETRFNEFYNKIDKSGQSQVFMNYKVYDINNLDASDNKDTLLKQYPDLAKEKMYVLRDGVQDYMRANMEKLFAKAGYTQADYDKDAKLYSGAAADNKPAFDVSIVYKLEEDGLKVSIPLKDIKCKKGFSIVSIKPLTYLGAGSTKDKGFMFVPDGSGGIIDFNNNKQSQGAYTSQLYGWDYGLKREALIDETKINMPVFGISNNTSSFICTLEDGSSYASIAADVSGRWNCYNYVSAEYTLFHNEALQISSKSNNTVRKFETSLPKEVISQKYTFIDQNDYVSMATAYRNYLMKKYPNLKKKTDTDLPVAVEIVGAIDRMKHVFGVPVRKPYALTKYDEAVDIVKKLKSDGISDLSVKYNGWANDGVLNSAPNKIHILSELGGKRDFKNMVSYMKDNNVKLYLESTFQFMYNNKRFDNFSVNRDAARFINRKPVELYPYNYVWFGQNTDKRMFYLTKPKYYINNMDSYANKVAGYGVKNIAFTDIGDKLGADYDEERRTSREASLKLQEKELAKLSKDGYGMMINSGNMYAAPYANMILNLNLGTKGYNIIDEEIPFYEIAVHGILPYAGEAINLTEDYEKNLLKSVETGAGLYFVFMKANSFKLQNSNYTKYYSSDFSVWSDKTSKLYNKMKKDFGNLYNQYIVNHSQLAKGVFMTEYEDGTKVIVNYNESAYNHNGTEIPAKDYLVEGGNQ